MSLEIKNLKKSFGEKKVLDDISFTLEKGEILSFIGRNGSGKTTTLKIIGRVLKADQGSVYCEGKNIDQDPHLQNNIAYLPDYFDYFKFDSPKKIMAYYQVIYPNFDEDYFNSQLERFKLDKTASVKSLSKGNLKLLGLITILATNAQYILLDEILDGIDVLNKKKIIQLIFDQVDQGKSFLISSHQIQELDAISDRALYLSLDGHLSGNQAIEKKIYKYQMVTEKLIQVPVQDFMIIHSIARVYTILSEKTMEEISASNPRLKIVQYDQLDLKYEDLFLMEEGEIL